MRNRIKFEGNRENVSIIRQYSRIRYDKKLNQQIASVLRRYNAKIDRLAKEQTRYMLPQKVTKEDLMEVSWTRRDLQRRLNNLEAFTKRGAEERVFTKTGYAVTKYELDYLKKEKARVKRNLQKSISWYERTKPKSLGKELPRTFAQMGDSSYLNLVAKLENVDVDISDLAIDELYDYRQLLYNLGKDRNYLAQNFKDNYFDILDDLASNVHYDKRKLNKIKNALGGLDAEKFYELYINEKSVKELVNWYHVFRKAQVEINESDVINNFNSLLENMEDIIKDYK